MATHSIAEASRERSEAERALEEAERRLRYLREMLLEAIPPELKVWKNHVGKGLVKDLIARGEGQSVKRLEDLTICFGGPFSPQTVTKATTLLLGALAPRWKKWGVSMNVEVMNSIDVFSIKVKAH